MPGVSAAEVLETLRTVAALQARFGPEAVGRYVISFTAAKGSVGQVEVQYQIADDTETSTAKVVFNYGNSAPILDAAGDSLPANTPKHYQLTFHDPDGDGVTSILFDTVSGPVDPTPLFVFNADGSFDFAGGPPGAWEIRFRVSDGVGTFNQVFTITTT